MTTMATNWVLFFEVFVKISRHEAKFRGQTKTPANKRRAARRKRKRKGTGKPPATNALKQ